MVCFFLPLTSLGTQSIYKGDLSCKSPSEANRYEDEQFSSCSSTECSEERKTEVECPGLENNTIYILQGQKVDKGKEKW